MEKVDHSFMPGTIVNIVPYVEGGFWPAVSHIVFRGKITGYSDTHIFVRGVFARWTKKPANLDPDMLWPSHKVVKKALGWNLVPREYEVMEPDPYAWITDNTDPLEVAFPLVSVAVVNLSG